ncbi:MAG: hypothetical protein JWQ30_1633, partial [Sediminibacterium sp.]|nr:hypothetical protein [Sediminibacterium sp.]
MKKSLVLILLLGWAHAFAQSYPITGINIVLPPNPDAITANWVGSTSPFTIRAAAKAASGRMDNLVLQCRLLMVVKKGGVIFCGSYVANTAPVANFN